jgi:DNA-binding NtrC family response regulator
VSVTLTVDSRLVDDVQAAAASRHLLGFVLLWSFDEPQRVGEVTLVPSMELGAAATLGRAESVDGGEVPRMEWLRQQPGYTTATGALRSPRISRTQLNIEVYGTQTLRVSNIGRCTLMLDGCEVSTALVSPGNLIELRGLALMMCVQRPYELPVADPPAPLHPFGEADIHGIVGESAAAWELRARIAFVAGRDAHVLIRGPSGTGKELVAQAIHHGSPRGQQSLIARSAATFPETLIDAELFGNAKSFPNPGMLERPGLVGEADGSTLFLDEFAELPLNMQAHLLRVLDSGEYTRLGEGQQRRADFRLIAATNRPETALKEDVLARLRLRVELCGLDQRREDIPLIAYHLLRRLARNDQHIAGRYYADGDFEAIPRVGRALIEYLVRYEYTTHVRELETLLWHAMAHGPREILDLWPAEVPPPASSSPARPKRPTGPRSAPVVALDMAELDYQESSAHFVMGRDPMTIPPEIIQACLDRHGGKQEPVWRELGLSSRHVLTRLVRKHGLKVKGRAPDTPESG